MAKLDPDLLDELASLVELDAGTFSVLTEETGDLDDGRVILGASERDLAFGGFYPGRLQTLHARGLIDYTGGIVELTDRGREVVRAAGGPEAPTPVRNDILEALEHLDLHEAIDRRVRRAFDDGDAPLAVFEAFRAIEVHVHRALARAGAPARAKTFSGVVTEAFKVGGPLADAALHPGEQEGVMHLYLGAVAAVRNPNAHRDITYEPAEALRLVLFADHLLRLVDAAPGSPA